MRSPLVLAVLAAACAHASLAGEASSQAQVTPPIVTPGSIGIDYDIVYVRQPRYGDQTNSRWPEVFHPVNIDPGADLMLLHPDGSEEVLVDCTVDPATGRGDSITDPFVSFDGQWVYFVRMYDASTSDSQHRTPAGGSDIFRIHLPTRAVEQLTHVRDPGDPSAPLPPGEFLPNTGAGTWRQTPDGAYQPYRDGGSSAYSYLSGGVFNMGPAPVAGGKIVFTSNRFGFLPPAGYTRPTLQLFTMDEDGANVRCIAPMNIGSALHPMPLVDGRIAFTTYESQGLRDWRAWGLWSIYPDGRRWGPLVSAMVGTFAFHFGTQLASGDLAVIEYYNLNNNGFGALYRLPVAVPAGTPAFGSPDAGQNPSIPYTTNNGTPYSFRMPFTPFGFKALTAFTTPHDHAAPVGADGMTRVGKVTHPSAAPDGGMFIVWTPGPANDLNRPESTPRYDAGLYLLPGSLPGGVVSGPLDLIGLKNDPAYNEAWPRPVVPYRAIHGVSEPQRLADLPNDGTLHADLPRGTPYGLVGTSSFYKRESFPNGGSASFNGLDPFNSNHNGASTNWTSQGSDVGTYANSEIWAVRVVAQEPATDRFGGPDAGFHFRNQARERLRILGEIPLRKVDGQGNAILDPEGNPDTSFLAKIAADTPFTFQTIDRNGLVLNMAQTWHQLRPGEVRTDCGGCHSHSQLPLDFAQTAAGAPGFQVADLTATTPLVTGGPGGQPGLRYVNEPAVDIEFYQDIRPILQASCVPCHVGPEQTAPGRLVLDDLSLHPYDQTGGGQVPGDYKRLADDQDAQWGIPPVISYAGNPWWRGAQKSRYIRAFQARRSLLTWKVFGQRLDGWTNADWPTESVPGDPSTLPPGADPSMADIDFNGQTCPPPGSSVPPLTGEQKTTIGRWIDLGCPINVGDQNGHGDFGWFLDEVRPALTVSSPRDGVNAPPPTEIRIGMADNDSGLDPATLSVKASIEINGLPPGTELAGFASPVADGVWTIPIAQPWPMTPEAHLSVSVRDHQGNTAWVERRFSVLVAPRLGQHNDPNGSLVLDGTGSSGSGPFPLDVVAGGLLRFRWSGPPFALLAIAAGSLDPAASSGPFGLLDLGAPAVLLLDGRDGNPAHQLDRDGFREHLYVLPAFPPGPLTTIQGAVIPLPGSGIVARRTAAFHLTVR